MEAASLATVREVHQSMREWIGNSEAPFQSLELLGRISAQLKRVDQAIREAPPALVSAPEWRETLAAYSETLGELGAHLEKLEITLRVRQLQLAHANSRLSALHSWAGLTRHIG